MRNRVLVIVAAIFITALVMGLWFYTGNEIPVIAACILLAAMILHAASKRILCGMFFMACLLTEFYYISFMGGTIRLYHIMALIMFACSTSHVRQLFSSVQFKLFVAFIVVNTTSVMMAKDVSDAFLCFLLLLANASLSVVTALILISGTITISAFKKIVLTGTLISLVWGLIQYSMHAATGAILALSELQIKNISWNMIPAFTTEAGCFMKYLSFPFMLFVPDLIRTNKPSKATVVFYIIAILSMVVSLVRNAVYGCIVATLYIVHWNIKNARMDRLIIIMMIAILGVLIILSLCLQGIIPVSEAVQHKYDVIFNFNIDRIEQESSGGFRIANIRAVIEESNEDLFTIILGKGWGQVYYYNLDQMRHTNVPAWLEAYGYGGLLGVLLYMLYSVNAFLIFRRAAMQSADCELSQIGEGLMYATIAMFVTSLFAKCFLAPEYWMLIGCSFFVDYRTAQNHREGRRIGQECWLGIER